MIDIGTLELADIVVGSTPIEKAYIDSQLVWEKSAPVLPYDAQVEWLYSNGSSQYIDTGIAYDSTVTIKGSVKLVGTVQGYYMFGIYTTVGGSARRWAVNAGTTTTVSPHFGTVTNVTAGFTRGVFHNISADYRYLTIDGAKTDTSTSAFTPEHDVNIYLYGRSEDNVAAGFRECYISWFKIYKNNVLVRDYIAVRKNGVGYLYDKVSGTLFGNAGSGSFTYGGDITEVEYLGFSGTQYISLDYWTGRKLEIETVLSLNTVANTEQDIIGNQCFSNDTKRRFILCVYNKKFCVVTRNNTGDNLNFTSNYAANTFYTVNMLLSPDDNTRRLTVDNSSVSSGLSYSVDNTWAAIRVGAGYNSNRSINYPFSGKIKKIKITGDNVLLYDLIPVRAGTTGYMYDRVSQTLFGNVGTGSFTCGPDVT